MKITIKAKFDFGDSVRLKNGESVGIVIEIVLRPEKALLYGVQWNEDHEMRTTTHYEFELVKALDLIAGRDM